MKTAEEILIDFLDCEGFNIPENAIPVIIKAMVEYANSWEELTDEEIEKGFNKWLIKQIGIQDADIFQQGTLVRQVVIDYAKWYRDRNK